MDQNPGKAVPYGILSTLDTGAFRLEVVCRTFLLPGSYGGHKPSTSDFPLSNFLSFLQFH